MGIYRIPLFRILADIDNGKVRMFPNEMLGIDTDTGVADHEAKAYRRRVLTALDDSLVMWTGAMRDGGYLLSLTTLGKYRLMELRAEVAR